MLGVSAVSQQQHNRLWNIERFSVAVFSYPCGSAAAFVAATIEGLCWHVILSRSLFLTFSLAVREDASGEKKRYCISCLITPPFLSTSLIICLSVGNSISGLEWPGES